MTPKIVVASVPWTDTDSPIMAPAVLKSALTQHGIDSVAMDLNQEIRAMIAGSDCQPQVVNFFITQKVDAQAREQIQDVFEFMVDRILSHRPEWVCLSLLTYLSQHPTRWLCFLLKQRCPNVKIVIGGPGCFSSLKSIDNYANSLKTTGLIDHYIAGDGEQSLPALISGHDNYAGIDHLDWQEIEDLNQLAPPDYSDYLWSLYKVKRVSILGSRGCVRRCTFCDIHEHWSKFQWRTAENIFAEMQSQYQQYGINIFSFADSLINGNQQEYRKLIRMLAEFNKHRPVKDRIRWTSFFIFRPERDMPEEDWQLTADSGALMLMVGVESFVDHIRHHLKKKFNNQDLEYGLNLARKYHVPLTLLLIVGYATETEQDHQEQLQWLRNHSDMAGNPIAVMSVGSTLAILPGTELYRTHKELGIEMHSDEVYQDWTNKSIGSTPEVRMQWHAETVAVAQSAGFVTECGQDNHVLIEEHIKKQYGQI